MASWARFMRDRRGVSAIEFALIAPLLILIYVGVAEIGNALTVFRRTSTVAATAADLTAQVKASFHRRPAGHRRRLEQHPDALSIADAAQDRHFQRRRRPEQ